MKLHVECTIQRFHELPKETREHIWRGFANSLFLVSFEFLIYKKSMDLVVLSVCQYIVLFFSLGIWNSDIHDVEHWKKIIYKLGRINRDDNSKIVDHHLVEYYPHLTHLLYVGLRK